MEKYEREKYYKIGKTAIKKSGILESYDKLLLDLLNHGFPKQKLNGDLFEYAAYFIEKDHHKKYNRGNLTVIGRSMNMKN